MSTPDSPDLQEGPRDALEHWPAQEPPERFATHTLAALDAGAHRPRRRARAWALAGAAAVAACLVVWGASLRPRHGHLAADARQQLSLGGRVALVAERGARLDWAWSMGGRSARVVQAEGEVFYRVDAGGPFTVETPYAAITVSGTCFKVEVAPMASNKGLLAAAAVGAVAGGLVVTVYEGHLRVENGRGALEAAAGDRVHAGQAAAPALALEPTPAGLMATRSAPSGGAPQTPEAVAAREQAAQVQVAALQARVRSLEQERGVLASRLASAAMGPLGGEPNDGRPPSEKYRDFTQAELRALASKCELRTDLPPLHAEPWTMSPELGAQLHLSDTEQATATAAVNRLREDAVAKVRALYVEATGDAAGAETLEWRRSVTSCSRRAAARWRCRRAPGSRRRRRG